MAKKRKQSAFITYLQKKRKGMGETGGVRKKRKRKRKLALGGKSRKGKSARRGGRRKRKRQALKDNSQVLIEPGQAGGRMGENVKSNIVPPSSALGAFLFNLRGKTKTTERVKI